MRIINRVMFTLLAGNLGEVEKLFEIEGSIDHNSWHVTLNARDPGLAKAVGKIALEGREYVKSVTIDHASGDRTSIVFSALQSGPSAMTADEAALF